ncbi:protein FRA10AC1 homolog [Diorhabda sublineata]|uniref:protein FRA10AC1 homolog n=1 Tax=Diorhabda sublineata TaxID=1163346 RepID=UPI0024E16EC7|nr:protein FRA10AC1 homolog [Diorhabda sublineata]
MSSLRNQMRYLNPYDIHKMIINDYILKRPGDTSLLKRDTSKDRNDYHVIVQNHKFLWEEDDSADTWEQQFAKRYYNKLFKEYCIGDLSKYKENKIALRWRIEKEVVTGKGQFICGNKQCNEESDLRTWEVNFGYVEHGEKKNALVKIRLCIDCSKKLNYHSKKKEIKRLKKKKSNCKKKDHFQEPSCSTVISVPEEIEEQNVEEKVSETDKESPWENHKPVEQKSRDEEMEEYLQDLLL